MLRKFRNWPRMPNIQLMWIPERKKMENREEEIIKQITFPRSLSRTERAPPGPDTWMNGVHGEWGHHGSLQHQSKKILKTFSKKNQFTHLQVKKSTTAMSFSAMNMQTMKLLNTTFKTLREMVFHCNFLSSQPINQMPNISKSFPQKTLLFKYVSFLLKKLLRIRSTKSGE